MHAPSSNKTAGDDWTLVIEPQGRLFDLKLRELWQYRDLIALFVRRDFVAQYKQTILGPAWHLITPLLTTITFTIIFGKIAQIPTDGVPPFLFYMAGTVLWGYFSGVLTGTSSTFTGNAGIFGKVYFPRLVVPVAGLMSRLIAFSIQFLFFLCFLVFFMARGSDVAPNAWALLTPLLLLMMAALGLGLGVIVSSLTTRYRDLTVVVGFGVQLLMYATPVIYPLSVLPEPYRTWMLLNPMAPIMEMFRHAYLGAGEISLGLLVYSMAPIMEMFRHAYLGAGEISVGLLFYSMALISGILLIGILLFNRVERTFMDTV